MGSNRLHHDLRPNSACRLSERFLLTVATLVLSSRFLFRQQQYPTWITLTMEVRPGIEVDVARCFSRIIVTLYIWSKHMNLLSQSEICLYTMRVIGIKIICCLLPRKMQIGSSRGSIVIRIEVLSTLSWRAFLSPRPQ